MRARPAGHRGLAVLGACLLGCTPRVEGPGPTWQIARPAGEVPIATLQDPRLRETSGVAESHLRPGAFWTHNDSGNPPWIFAIDSLGRTGGVFALDGARNVDWEDIAEGPCPDAEACLYIADTGDNMEVRRSVMIYRLPEPLTLSGAATTRRARVTGVIEVTYPDRPRDVEAMFILPNGDMHLVSKGRNDGILHYRIRAAAWDSSPTSAHPHVTAELLERLPIAANLHARSLVTGADATRDGQRVVVRTLTTLYFFSVESDGTLSPDGWAACDVWAFGAQGEGVAWLADGRLAVTSERVRSIPPTLAQLSCASPG